MNIFGVVCVCVCGRHTLSTEEFARNVQGFGSNNDNLLAIEKLLCDGTGETTEQMSLAVNNNLEISPPCQLCVTKIQWYCS